VVLALLYVDRIARRNPSVFLISSWSVHRLLLAGVVVAAKFVDDSQFTNRVFSKMGGVTLDEMNNLEMSFCKLCNFELFVSREELVDFEHRSGLKAWEHQQLVSGSRAADNNSSSSSSNVGSGGGGSSTGDEGTNGSSLSPAPSASKRPVPVVMEF
jgi:hypothetical protein